jgi:hypothetical protein
MQGGTVAGLPSCIHGCTDASTPFPHTAPFSLFFTDAGGPNMTSLQYTAAQDWTSLAQRMRFIVPLMRSRQNDPSLDCAVLSAANLADLQVG